MGGSECVNWVKCACVCACVLLPNFQLRVVGNEKNEAVLLVLVLLPAHNGFSENFMRLVAPPWTDAPPFAWRWCGGQVCVGLCVCVCFAFWPGSFVNSISVNGESCLPTTTPIWYNCFEKITKSFNGLRSSETDAKRRLWLWRRWCRPRVFTHLSVWDMRYSTSRHVLSWLWMQHVPLETHWMGLRKATLSFWRPFVYLVL